jgi:hypothetical protein
VIAGNSQVRGVEIPLLDCSGLPCIEMTTGSGKTLRMLIDLAEANAYLDTKTAQALASDTQPLKSANDAAISQVQQTVVPGAKIADLPLGDFPFMVLDTTTDAVKPGQKPAPLPADGALTFRAFQNRLLQIDFGRHLVRISEPQDAAAPCPQQCSDLVVKHFGNYGPVTLTLQGFTVNGQAVDAQIDTLFAGTMLIYPDAVKTLGLKKEAKSKHKEIFPFVQGGLQLANSEGGATISFRDMPLMQDCPLYFLTAEDNPVKVSFDATVGTGLLNRAVVTFDFKGMHMWMEPGAAAAVQSGAQGIPR